MAEDANGDLPYCSQCFKSLLRMRYPFLATCNHLFCLDCTNHLVRNDTLQCPLDNTVTPSGHMALSEVLKTLTRKYSLASGSDRECLMKEAEAAINLSSVRCKRTICTRAACPYIHSPPAGVEQADYFEATEPPLQLSYLDLDEEDDRVLLRSYLDLTISSLYH